MANPSVIEAPPKRLAEAENRNEYRKLRAEQKKAAAAPPTEEKKPEAPPSDTGSESAEVSETSNQNSQEQQEGQAQAQSGTEGDKKPEAGKGRSLKDRLAQLRAQGKHDEADKILRDSIVREEEKKRQQLEQELQTYRTRKPDQSQQQQQNPPAATPPPATQQQQQPAIVEPPAASPDDPRPDQSKYDGSEGKTYEDYLSDLGAWKYRQQEQQRQREQQQQAIKTAVQQKLAHARSAHPDFDQVTAGDPKNGIGFIMTPPMQEYFVFHPLGAELMYKLATDQAEYQRIRGLSRVEQSAELGWMAKQLSTGTQSQAQPPAQQPPENRKPPASKVSPPPPRPGGGEAPAPKDPSEARNREEYKRLRHQQRGRR